MTSFRTSLALPVVLLSAIGLGVACGPMPAQSPVSDPGDAGAASVSVVDASVAVAPTAMPLIADAAAAPTAAADAGAPISPVDGGGGVAVFIPNACVRKGVRLSADVLPIVQHNCSGVEGCHRVGSASAASKFFSAAANSCTDSRKVVAPGDPSHSYIIDKLTDARLCSGSPMPKTLMRSQWHQLAAADVQTIYDWICGGAPND